MLKGRLGLETARIPHADRHGCLWLRRGTLYVENGTLRFKTGGSGELERGDYALPVQTISSQEEYHQVISQSEATKLVRTSNANRHRTAKNFSVVSVPNVRLVFIRSLSSSLLYEQCPPFADESADMLDATSDTECHFSIPDLVWAMPDYQAFCGKVF